MDVYKTIITLRAIRHFSKKKLSNETLNNILEAGRWSGSAKNTEPWHFIVVQDQIIKDELAKCGWYASHLKGADTVIVIVADSTRHSSFDTGRAAQNMMLAAWSEGIGSCIATLHKIDHAYFVLDVPKEKQIQIAISLGYPINNPPLTIEGQPRKKILNHIGRRSLEEIVHREKW